VLSDSLRAASAVAPIENHRLRKVATASPSAKDLSTAALRPAPTSCDISRIQPCRSGRRACRHIRRCGDL